MKAIWQVLFTSLAVFLTVQLSAQSVTIQVALTPPYSPNFSDYENQLLMTLTNTTAQTVQIKLTGEIMNQDNSRYVRTSPQYQPAQPIVLQPNEVKTLFGNQDKTGFLDKNNVETNYTEIDKANILLSGLIPEGMYDVCINALDFTTGAPLSQPACQIIAIGYPAPPIPILPSCNSEVRDLLPVFNWLPPVGNFPNASLVYDMYLVKVPDGEDPNQVMLFAINGNNIQDLWEIPNITTTNYTYQPSDAPLVNDQNYVWAVRVHDQNNSVSFQNGGLSQICTFKWIDPANKLPDLPIACQNDCAVDVDLNSVAYHPSVNPNDFVKIGDFSMKIITFTVDQTKPYDQFSGMGMIDVPFLNSKKFRLRVKFTDIVLSTDMHVLAGKARGIRSSGFSVLPDFNDPTWTGQTLAQTTLTTIDDYLKNVWANGGDAIETINNTIGWEMPFGGTIKGHTLAATDIEFYPNHATLDAIAIVPLPQYSASMPVTRLGLGIGGLCLNSQTFCKEGKIHLFQDFGVDLDPQNPGDELVLKSATPDNSTKPADKAHQCPNRAV